MFKKLIFAAVLAVCPLRCLMAGNSEVSLYYLNNASLEYEGSGFRQVDHGWELKVKPPHSVARGVRWQHPLKKDLAIQVMYVGNKPFFSQEDGNSINEVLRQTGETRMTMHSLMADLRRPLEDSSIGVMAGLQGAKETFLRKDIIFDLTLEPHQADEDILAAGAYVGFYGGRAPEVKRTLYWDWEGSIGHFFITHNTQKTRGGSIHSSGFSYTWRLEGGWNLGDWRFSLGYFRQELEIMVPGGKTLPGGAAASFPLNKTDFKSPFLTVSYAY